MRLSNSDLFVALDYPDKNSAQLLLDQLPSELCHIKVGLEMFTRAGPVWVAEIAKQGYQIFLDLKLYDIPQTVAKTVSSIGEMGVAMTTLHASGGEQMMRAARMAADALPLSQRPLLIAVTVLTSFSQAGWEEVIGQDNSIAKDALRLALLARDSGMDGVVCSPNEAAAIRKHCGPAFKIICPGIRLADSAALDDQVRIATPNCAREQGADYLVVGRPIRQAEDPHQALSQYLNK
jgi:orotidine-5'-phosphate decarboxylase